MPVPSNITDLSTTAGSNSPSGSESPGDGDNYIRQYGAFIALLRDKLNGTSDTGTVKNATFSGSMAGAASWAALQTFAAGITVTGTATFNDNPDGKVKSGTYTPTLTTGINVTAATPSVFQYTRIGDVVNVSGQINATTTAANTPSAIDISLPIASSLTLAAHLVGGVGNADHLDSTGVIYADAANDRADLLFVSPASASQTLFVHFQYRVL